MENEKYGLIRIVTDMKVDYQYTKILCCKEKDQLSCMILGKDEISDLTIEEMRNKYSDKLLTENKKSREVLFDLNYQAYIDLKSKSIKFPNSKAVSEIEFYISKNNKHFLIYDKVSKNDFLKEFCLIDVDEEWKKIQQICENKELTFKEIKENLGIIE